ncbi:MAG: NAD(P)-binding protein [Nanoarchaeota archaeon]
MSKGAGIKEIEELPKRLRIFFWVILFLFVFGTIGFRVTSEETISASLYRTTHTLAFMFNDDSTIPERFMEMTLAIVGVFLVWWVLWSIADLILEGKVREYLKRRISISKVMKMKNHIIIVGGGRVGEEIARVLKTKNRDFLIIESEQKMVSQLRKKKYLVVKGDAQNDEALKAANIEKAAKIILTLPKTETNILLTLTAKELNPKIEVHSRCESPGMVSKLKRAGAEIVTIPEIIAADKIAKDLGI